MMTEVQPVKWPSTRHGCSRDCASDQIAGINSSGAASEKTRGMYSAGARKEFVLCARKMSGARPARLNNANNSTHIRGLRQLLVQFPEIIGLCGYFLKTPLPVPRCVTTLSPPSGERDGATGSFFNPTRNLRFLQEP